MKSLLLIGLPPLLAGALAACGANDPPAGQATDPTTPRGTTTPPSVAGPGGDVLDGRDFVSSDVRGYQLVDGTQIRLSFDGADIGASAGCNSLGSTWSLDGDVLRVAPMAGTEMACEPAARMDQDTWLATFLTAGPTLALDGDTLTIADGTTSIALVDSEVAEPDRQLEGTTWVLDGIVTGDAVSSVPAGIRVPTLDFVAGELAVDTGCNTGGGTYEASDDVLTIGPIRLTEMACADEAGNEVERSVVAALEGEPTFVIDADVLMISNGDAGLVYRAMDSGPPASDGG